MRTRLDSTALALFVALGAPSAAGCNAVTGADGITIGGGGAPADDESAETTGAGDPGAGGAGAEASTTGSGGGAQSSTSAGAGGDDAAASSSSSSTSSGGVDPGGDALDAAAQLCVDTINAHRATLGLAPYARWKDAEPCAGEEAQKDSVTGQAHSAFGLCGEWAQNECPGWPGAPAGMIADCLQMMWDEGPGDFNDGHGHYINMSNPQYTRVSCGFYVLPDGSVWATQDFQ